MPDISIKLTNLLFQSNRIFLKIFFKCGILQRYTIASCLISTKQSTMINKARNCQKTAKAYQNLLYLKDSGWNIPSPFDGHRQTLEMTQLIELKRSTRSLPDNRRNACKLPVRLNWCKRDLVNPFQRIKCIPATTEINWLAQMSLKFILATNNIYLQVDLKKL